MGENWTQNIERRTSNAQRRTQKIEHRISNTEHRTLNAECRIVRVLTNTRIILEYLLIRDGTMSKSKFDLEDRLLEYAVTIIRIVEAMDRKRSAFHVGNQFLRSSTSPLFNHGEAESAESTREFIHKLKICLKELRETKRGLLLVQRVPLIRQTAQVSPAIDETDQLIRIFVTSIRTAQARLVNPEVLSNDKFGNRTRRKIYNLNHNQPPQ